MDLSWPHNGRSVNDGISKDRYLEQVVQLQCPTVDMLCKKAMELKVTSEVKGQRVQGRHG